MNSQEWMCLWYLRLNGYFTTPNFIAHRRGGTLTEVDILGVRFPHSIETADGTQFDDDQDLGIPGERIDVVFAEAKRNRIDELNGPWRDPSTRALDYVLRRAGMVPGAELATLAEHLYKHRKWVGPDHQVRIVVFADTIGDGLRKEEVAFVGWQQVLSFVRKRFTENDRLKAEHEAWDEFGQYLWKTLTGVAIPTAAELFDNWTTMECR